LFRSDNRLRMEAAISRKNAAACAAANLPRPDEDDEAQPTLRFRAIFISDVHLGTAGCQATQLLDFLRHTESGDLYLVGDIIDGWQLKRRWYWHQTHNDVVQKVLRKARKGTRVTYIAGNHDEAVRQFLGLAFGGIDIRDEAEHVTADGRRMLVTHGDLFDAVVKGAKWLAHVGDALYLFSLRLNRWFNHARAKLGLPYWSLAQFLKHRVKNAVGYITQFEDALAHEAQRRGFDGVICGHIHKAEIRDIGGILYCNDGDWVESLTALVELESGELRIIDWKVIEALQRSALAAEDKHLAYSPGN
jgi:UDP-2,3-diacylglucosamine pyrophosphatase LpxH